MADRSRYRPARRSLRGVRAVWCLLCLLALPAAARAGGSASGLLRLGFDTAGNHEVSIPGRSGTLDVDDSLAIGGELFSSARSAEFGGGIEYQLSRAQEDVSGNFNFIPMYALLRVFPLDTGRAGPCLTARAGYNAFDGDSSYSLGLPLHGGLYYAGGLGYVIDSYQLDIIYSVNNGYVELTPSVDADIRYTKLSLSMAARF